MDKYAQHFEQVKFDCSTLSTLYRIKMTYCEEERLEVILIVVRNKSLSVTLLTSKDGKTFILMVSLYMVMDLIVTGMPFSPLCLIIRAFIIMIMICILLIILVYSIFVNSRGVKTSEDE